MQKILIVSSKGLSSKKFDGGEKRIFDIARFLSKKNKIDFVCAGNDQIKKSGDLSFLNEIRVFKINFINRILNTLISVLNLKPAQLGFFFSKDMKSFVLENHNHYDTIIFHLIRSAQYLPDDYTGKKILEMTDLGSYNYEMTINELSLLNPMKYIYFLENILLKKYEKEVSNLFDKVVFISKKEFFLAKKILNKNKIVCIGNMYEVKKKVFKFKSNNYKILFVGNIGYFPNKIACYNFSKNILPKLNSKLPKAEFNIVGKINFIDKFFMSFFENVKVHGPVDKLDNIVKNSICGICNLKNSTGVQNKIFTYMSYALPAVVNKKSDPKNLIGNKDIILYKNDDQLIKYISFLAKNKKLSNKISKNGFNFLKNKFKLSRAYANYYKIV